jgi:hypothetical protein
MRQSRIKAIRLTFPLFMCCTLICTLVAAQAELDPRNIEHGYRIPDEGYCDQPYVVILPNGNWLCTLTTGSGREGERDQHIVSTVSSDQGRSWSSLVDIEPADGPEASWVVPLVIPSGRVYAFYTYNGDRIHELNGREIRADTVGWYCYRYSDDCGRSWSQERYRLPMRVTACDRANDWQGDVQIFWGICKPITIEHDVLFSFTKLGKYMLDLGEGWIYRSPNLLSECDVSKLQWELLPEGDHGIRAEQFGSIQEEHNLVATRDGLYCVYRTTNGYPCHTYSSDGGRSWEIPAPMSYSPGGRTIKNPRACPRVWKTSQGKYLFWFHNHGGQGFQGRNPVWVAGGEEKGGRIHWSQPEILLYAKDPSIRMSYPDLIEQDGDYWVTETQKSVARVHKIDRRLLQGLWSQGTSCVVAQNGLILSRSSETAASEANVTLPSLDISRAGITLDLWIRLQTLSADQILLDARDKDGQGLLVRITDAGTIGLDLIHRQTVTSWDTDPGKLSIDKLQHVVMTVDPGPGIITTLVDGILCDGGAARERGWTHYAGDLPTLFGDIPLRLAPRVHGELQQLRIYDRSLTTSEAVAHFHAGIANQ